MHLLKAQSATPEDAGEAIDLGQTPGDIVFLSAADTELACLVAAQARRPRDGPSLRLANLLQLGHPMSVDLYVEQVVSRARLVVLRLLGGRSYWPYGLEQVVAVCRAGGIPHAVLSGDDQPDPELQGWSSLPAEACHRLWQYLVHGGLDNAGQFLTYAAALLGGDGSWREPAPLMRAGLYWPGLAQPDLEAVQRQWQPDQAVAALVFYRALVQAGDLEVINSLIEALGDERLNVLPIFTASLKDPIGAPLVRDLLQRAQASVVLNATGFAVSGPGAWRPTPLDEPDRSVLQVVLAGGSEAAWRAGTRGLSARDLAMNVALPELDGRVLSRAVAFKTRRRFDPATESNIVGFAPVKDRVGFTAALAAAWARLGATPVAERRVAIVLANYPNRDGRIANGVGLDTPASTMRLLEAMREAGYRIDDPPDDGQALIERLLGGVTNELSTRADRVARVALPVREYATFFEQLSARVQQVIVDRWGAPDADPHVVDAAFALAMLPLGNVVVGIQPARGYHIDPSASYHDPDLPPPHGYLAFYAWLRQTFGAHAIIHMGKHGNLEWLPGKALALSADCFPEAVLGPLPHIYPFIVNDPGEGAQAKRRAAAVIVDHLTPPLTRAETYGPLSELERLVDEYYEAAGLDPRRVAYLRGEILALSTRLGLDRDIGIACRGRSGRCLEQARQPPVRAQGTADPGRPARVRPGSGRRPADRSAGGARQGAAGFRRRRRCIAAQGARRRSGPGRLRPAGLCHGGGLGRPEAAALQDVGASAWRSNGDTVERLELLARSLIGGQRHPCTRMDRDRCSARAGRARPATCVAGRAERRRSDRCCGRWRVASSSPARAAPRPAAGPTCCRPGATSSRSTRARCRPRRRGTWAGNRRPC